MGAQALSIDEAIQLGLGHQRAGRLDAAAMVFANVVRAAPRNADALHLLGVVLDDQGRPAEAAALIQRAIAADQSRPDFYDNLGVALGHLDDQEAALAAHRRALRVQPNFLGALYNVGLCLSRLGRGAEALPEVETLLKAQPGFARGWQLLGAIYRELDRLDDATYALEEAVALDPRLPSVVRQLALCHVRAGRHAKAAALLRQEVDRGDAPAEVYTTLGNALLHLRESRGARDAFRRAAEMQPESAVCHNNLGTALEQCGALDAAVESYTQALQLDPALMQAHQNLGNLWTTRRHPLKAVHHYGEALRLQPDYTVAAANLWFQARHVCDWATAARVEPQLAELTRRALAEQRFSGEPCLVHITRSLDAAENLALARCWATGVDQTARAQGRMPQRPVGQRDRLRIGYLSNDLRDHPVAHLIAGLFSAHDRSVVEVFAYSMGPDDGSAYRRQLEGAADCFRDISTADHRAVAQLIHDDQIDILVDLMGHTRGARPEVCALRPAPVQVTWLGYPGTTGATFFDYIVTDPVVGGPAQDAWFSEARACLPHCYQMNDDQQHIQAVPLGRRDFHLPDDAVVFCSFNQSFKLDPQTWDVWMRILGAVPGSVLWLLSFNDETRSALRAETIARGIDPARVIFAGWLDKARHLFRLGLADLVLDTRVYGGHTSTSDALWAGVPVLTLQGSHFPSRVAASLLRTVGLDELITHSVHDYEAQAIALAGDPDRRARLRDQIQQARRSSPLYDTVGTTRDLERAYAQMWRQHLSGAPPVSFDLEPR